MAEEEKKDGQREAETAKANDEPDYRKLYEEQQAEVKRLNADNKKKDAQLDELAPYVDFDAIARQYQGVSNNEEAQGGDSYVEGKVMKSAIDALANKFEGRIAALQFYVDNADLKDYKGLVNAKFAEVARTNPRKSVDERLAITASEVREFLNNERAKGQKQAEEKEKLRKDELEKASGLGSSADTAPENVEKGESKQDWVDSRRKRLEQMKTPAGI